ncbi:MAG: hypothetical protein JXB03_13060 [Spirochaetales bacterium]|nr:hypothetical protein [Spirochaetales bacterium]
MKAFILVSAILLVRPLICQELISFEKVIDWNESQVVVTAMYDFAQPFQPQLRLKAQRELEKAFPGLLKTALLDMTVDSSTTVLDALLLDSGTLKKVERLFSSAVLEASVLTRDFKSMKNSYIVGFYPSIAEAFLTHTSPRPIRPLMEPAASGNFSGILIYAKGVFDVYGENTKDELKPCLFPKLRDYKSEVLFEYKNMSYDDIISDGMVYYTDSSEDPVVDDRVGLVPLRIYTSQIFGIHRTDIVLSQTDTHRLLSDESVIKLLTTGRVAVILDLP